MVLSNKPHQQPSLSFVGLKLRTFALQHLHQISVCSLKVLNGLLSVKSFCSLATVQLHSEYELNKEGFESLYYRRISLSNSDTAR